MKIVVGNLNFTSIKEFTDYLEKTYEQDKSITTEITLNIDYDAPNPEDTRQLIDFLTKSDRTRLYHIQLVSENKSNEQLELNHYITILSLLAEGATPEALGKLKEALESNRIFMGHIAKLFQYPPYPKLKDFIVELNNHANDIRTYLNDFDLDPKAGRVSQFNEYKQLIKSKENILNEQFNISQVSRVVANIINSSDGAYLSSKQQFDLTQQVMYINAIGKDHPLTVGKHPKSNLTTFTRAELLELSEILIVKIRKPGVDTQTRLKAQLNLLAVMREQYFRSTGQFINTTQLTSILLLLSNPRLNPLMEMDSEEHNSSTKAIIAAMQWVTADGGTVDVCLRDQESLGKDYKDKGIKDFFKLLGIPSAQIDTGSPAGTYQVGGINYSTISDLAAYRARAKVEKEQLTASKYAHKASSNLIFDASNEEVSKHKTVLDFYKQHGRLIGTDDFQGANEALEEQVTQLDLDLAYRVPSHHESKTKKLTDAQRAQNEEAAVEHYYRKAASTIQQVVLRQLEDWQALLHLIYPETEWTKLDKELVVFRDELARALSDEWIQCLASSNPNNLYPNPYVRRDGDNKIHTQHLDKALKKYEDIAEFLWNKQKINLKVKTEGKMIEGSVNALRFKHLDDVKLHEQLKLNKLEVRQNKKIALIEKKQSKRYVESGLDVNGALLSYSDDKVEQYREAFVSSQFKLIVRDILIEINNSSLSDSTKQQLIHKVNSAEKFPALEMVLIEYDKNWLGQDNFSEKYRMQPVIKELFRVHQQAGLAQNAELNQLKKVYLDNVATDIVQHLESTLSWVKEENRGFWYWLERTAVKNAANEVLRAVEEVKTSPGHEARQEAIKKLYKVLAQHQAKLEDLWIFSFGHKNTRTLINQTLNTIDGLTVIGSGKDELDVDFINSCKEEAHGDLMKAQLTDAIEKLEKKNNPWLKANPEWLAIRSKLHSIESENDTIYAIQEMSYLVSNKVEELQQSKSQIFNPLIQLRGSLRSIWDKFYQKHHEIVSETRHFDLKAQKILRELEGVEGFHVNGVKIKAGNTGFSDYYDLIITGSGPISLFNQFIRYQSKGTDLLKECEELAKRLGPTKAQLLIYEKLKKEQLPLIQAGLSKDVELNLFPKDSQDKVRDILEFQRYVAGQMPDNFQGFSPEIQNQFHDRELLQSLELTQVTLDNINKLKDKELKAEFVELYNKVYGKNVEKPTPWYSRLLNMMVSPFTVKEGIEDWQYQFVALKGIPNLNLRDLYASEITKKLDALSFDLQSKQAEVANEIESIHEQVEFLNKKIVDEEKKSGLMIKRFTNVGQIYEFETELKNYKAKHPKLHKPESYVKFYSGDESNLDSEDEFKSVEEDTPKVQVK